MSEGKGRLFVHVGLPRTGSTTIRHALRKLEPELRERGILVPVTARRDNEFSHSNLVTFLSGEWYLGQGNADDWRTLEHEIASAGYSTVLLTGSMFAAHGLTTRTPGHIAAQHIENLAAACGLEVHILGYVRPQVELLESLYAQMTLRAMTGEPFSEYARNKLCGDLLDFNRMFQPWRERFGANVKVAALEETVRTGGPVRHFLEQIGLPELAPARTEQTNARSGARTVEMRRRVVETLIESGLGLRARQTAIARLEFIRSPHEHDSRFAPFTQKEVRSVTERFSACNSKFAQSYGIDPNAMAYREHAEDEARRPNRIGPDDLDESEHALVHAYVRKVIAEARNAERTAPRVGDDTSNRIGSFRR